MVVVDVVGVVGVVVVVGSGGGCCWCCLLVVVLLLAVLMLMLLLLLVLVPVPVVMLLVVLVALNAFCGSLNSETWQIITLFKTEADGQFGVCCLLLVVCDVQTWDAAQLVFSPPVAFLKDLEGIDQP